MERGRVSLLRVFRQTGWATLQRDGDAGDEYYQQDNCASDAQSFLMSCRRSMQPIDERWHGQRSNGQHSENGDSTWGLRCKSLCAIAQPTHEEGQAQHEQAVPQDRADQRRLHYIDQPGAQGKDAYKEFGQVAKRGLQDAGCPRTESRTELIGSLPDEIGQQGKRYPCDNKNKYGIH